MTEGHYFYKWLSTCNRTICWKDYLFATGFIDNSVKKPSDHLKMKILLYSILVHLSESLSLCQGHILNACDFVSHFKVEQCLFLLKKKVLLFCFYSCYWLFLLFFRLINLKRFIYYWSNQWARIWYYTFIIDFACYFILFIQFYSAYLYFILNLTF